MIQIYKTLLLVVDITVSRLLKMLHALMLVNRIDCLRSSSWVEFISGILACCREIL